MSSIDVIAAALEPSMPALGDVSSPDGAITLLLTDIADAPAMAQRLGADAWASLLRDRETMVRQLVSRHDGSILRAEGDGFMASFASAHAGLHCAVEMQLAFGSDAPMRMGLHAGFVIAANPEQLLGRNVVLAARIAAKAKAGEILVSSALKEYTEADPGFVFEERGEFYFKGVHGEHTIYMVRGRSALAQ